MNQDTIRNDLKKYLEDNGIKNKFIAKQIGLSESMISYFLNGKKRLSSNSLNLIYNIIYN
ncbi:helix-turn-helix domain-containing protein [Clostridium beijerinckii]|uniref:Transcriptional regulator n=1 Tax=Clostridium beijerinckii TaxID=1520 RepID=A0AAX0B2E2_CLOBE|nr:helix-turn-helix transcriptional regulator [Clostridium beijerinckii]NRT88893.1 putative transcriptional regulator [Clostridium beijerinckii]NYC74348.1 putative transcriptional regulator [Clostridium beijerinckii]